MRHLTECLVCEGTELTEYAASTFVGDVDEAPQYFLANRKRVAHGRIVTCQTCGFRFTSPQFEADDYDEIYRTATGTESSAVPVDSADMRRFRRLARYVRQDVGSGGRFLDFGCGRGGFLAAMDDPTGLGFDVGAPGAHRVGSSTVITGKFFELLGREPFVDGAFDFITAFDVFEHLPDPGSYLQALTRLMAPGGRLVITVPDLGSRMAALAGRHWNMYLLEHLWYFNEKTFGAFIARAGFQQVRSRKVPYDASLAHIARRLAHTYAPAIGSFGRALPEIILPVPAGVMYGVFERPSRVAIEAERLVADQ